MAVIWSAFKNGIKDKLNVQLAVDIIANINERKEDFFIYLKKVYNKNSLKKVKIDQFWGVS